jgi:hypothetical protein
MTDPRHGDADLQGTRAAGRGSEADPHDHPLHAPSDSPSGSVTVVGAAVPKGLEFAEPMSPRLYTWFRDFAKATRSIRVYADNNEMFHKFVDRAHQGLSDILLELPELNFSVREDRILFNKDPVHINADREDGIPFTLYRNAFRRITLLRGLSRDELIQLMRAITTDHSQGTDYAGEDLVTTLWRLALPHLRYLTIDAITSEGSGANAHNEDLQRIQASIEDIVAAIYRNNAADDDIVAGVSITREDLEALKEIRKESVEDLEMLDRVTERAIVDIPGSQLNRVRTELTSETRDDLVRRVVDIFLRILFREQSAREFGATIEIILQLFESMVLGGGFDDATELVERIRVSADRAESLQEMHIAKHLLQLFAAETRVLPVLEAFNDEYKTSSVGDKVRFLKALGSPVAPVLLRSLESLTTPGHRRLICDLIVDFGVPSPAELMHASNGAKWFVVRDILSLAQRHPPERVGAIIGAALNHEHPKVRQHAVGMLRGYARGLADRLLAERVNDEEIEVRLAAARVAAARRSPACRVELEHYLNSDAVFEREPRELRTFMAAYAAIAADEAVPLLGRILNPSLLNQLKGTDAQVAAAFALAGIPSAEAAAALQRGARSLSGKVRDACKRALAKEFRRGESQADILTGRGLRIPEASTTNPNAPLPGKEELDPTPPSGSPLASRGNSADVEFTVGNTQDVVDSLDGAPSFSMDLPIDPEAPTQAVSVINRTRPSMPRVDPRNNLREEMPSNLPRAPGAYASTQSGSVDVMPERLPPAWGAPVYAEARTQRAVLPPEPAPASSADDVAAVDTYDAVQRELMAYLGLGEEQLEAPGEAVAPGVMAGPAFGGAAADSGIFRGRASAPDSDPAWGLPSGARLPEDMLDIPMEPEVEAEPPARVARTLPSEAHTEVGRPPPRLPPEAPTEVGRRPAVPVDDLFLEDPEGGA